MEMKGTFRLRYAAIESHTTHHVSECARDFFRAVVLLQVYAREGERYVTAAKRSPASLADRGEGAELDETARRAADGIKTYIDSQGVLLYFVPHHTRARCSVRRSRRLVRLENAQDAPES